jgi:hypothetical protein
VDWEADVKAQTTVTPLRPDGATSYEARLRAASGAISAPSFPARPLLERGNVAFQAFDLLRLGLKCGDR